MEAETREALERMGAAAIFQPIEADMQRVEAKLQAVLQVDHAELQEMATYLMAAGGKRVRPALALLSGRLFDGSRQDLVDVAVVVELVHMATLVHDDVIDGAAQRRGLPAVQRRWKNTVAILLGDFLFATAFSMLADLEEPRMVKSMAETVFEMCGGEIQQQLDALDLDQSIEDYYRRINRKTAFFIAETCRLGAIVGRAPPRQEKALRQFGYHIGMGFQIIDDILDLTSSAQELGKPIGSDLRGGLLTLPVLYGLRHPRHGEELRSILLEAEPLDDEAIHRIRHRLESSGAFGESYETARGFIAEAKAMLDRLPAGETRDILHFLADFIVERTY